MKRYLFLVLALIFATPAYAERGVLTNLWASWVNVTSTATMDFPSNSRDITIMNGDATDSVCVDLRGNATSQNCFYGGGNTAVQIGPGETLSLYDFTTANLYFRVPGPAAASPVSVIVTY